MTLWKGFRHLRGATVIVTAAIVSFAAGCERKAGQSPVPPNSGAEPADVRADAHGHAEPEAEHGHAHDEAEDRPNSAEGDAGHVHGEACAGHEHGSGATDPEPSDGERTAIPPLVRQNLGITFVKAERRPVRKTIRLPGQFELRPEARREYHVMLSGRVELLVRQYQRVKAGEPLFYLESPEWQKMQSGLVVSFNDMRRSHSELAVAAATLAETEQTIEFLERRVENLAGAQVRRVELEAELAGKRNTLYRLEAERQAAESAFDAAHIGYDVALRTAASVTGIPREELDPVTVGHSHMTGPLPPWREVARLTIVAEAGGIVDRVAVTNRGWAETGDLVIDTFDPQALRFHADALQTDINRFADGQYARVSPPPGGSIDLQDGIDGRIFVGFQAHAEQRVVPIYLIPAGLPRWAKAGVTAYLDVFIGGSADSVTAIPGSCVVRDGLDMIFFRRDPHDPNQVVRVVSALGADDGRWVEIMGGVNPGDEVVLGGVYPLMLAGSKSGEFQAGGHFHADGAFHKSDDH